MWFTSIDERISAISASFAPALLDITLKGTVVLLIAVLANLSLRRSSAAMRYLVWFLSVMTVLLLPVLSATLPSWRILPPVSITGTPIVTSQTEPAFISKPTIIPAVSDTQMLPMYSPPHALISTPRLALHDPQFPIFRVKSRLGWQAWLLIVWLIGSVSYLVYLMLGYLYLWRLQRRSYPLIERPWPGLLNQASATVGFQRSVELIGNSGRALPMTWGIFKTRILIPADSVNWNSEQCRAVLLHELAHAKRLDCLTQLITQFACALYWFNPLMWFAWHRMQTEREQACDDMVLSSGTKPSAYAQQLLHIAAQVSSARFANIAIAMARPSNLEGRLLAILDVKRNRQMISWTAGLAAILVMAFIATPLAMLHAADQPQANAATSPATAIDQLPVDPVTIAQGIIDHMSHGEFKQATDPFDSVMTKLAPPQTLEQIWKLLDQSGGKYLGRGISRTTHEKQFEVVYVPMKWAHNTVEMKVVFDDKNQVAGMWTVDPQAPAATTKPAETQAAPGQSDQVIQLSIHNGLVQVRRGSYSIDGDKIQMSLAGGPLFKADVYQGQVKFHCKDTDMIADEIDFLPSGKVVNSVGAKPATVPDHSEPQSDTDVVHSAVSTISTCTEGDPKIAKALEAVKGIDQTSAVVETTKFLDSDEDNMRRAAIYVLWRGEFNSIDPAIPSLIKLCQHTEEFTRGMSALALGQNHATQSNSALMDMATHDQSPFARRCAVYALGLLGNADALSVLRKALTDPDPAVANNAKAAIKMLTAPATPQK